MFSLEICLFYYSIEREGRFNDTGEWPHIK